MKTVKILLVNMLLLLLIGCGGDSSDTPTDKNSTKTPATNYMTTTVIRVQSETSHT